MSATAEDLPMEVGAFQAKTHLSELLEKVRGGERITITKHGVPVAVLVPPADEARARAQGALRDLRVVRQSTRTGSASIRELRDEGRQR